MFHLVWLKLIQSNLVLIPFFSNLYRALMEKQACLILEAEKLN